MLNHSTRFISFGLLRFSTLLTVLLFATSTAFAVPTNIVVKVKSKDAKFVGTSMGGALITVKNADTGELLAKGVTAGSTGNTKLIMQNPVPRGGVISDEGSAKFATTIDIEEPMQIEITAFGPLGQRQSANRVSLTQWVVPGKHIANGDAFLMELPGFAVDVLAPPSHSVISGVEVALRANVTMMCGCPITPDGLWDAKAYEVVALVKKEGKSLGEQTLAFAGETSQFQTALKLDGPGTYEVTVYAYDKANGNTGVDKTTFMVK